MKQLSLNNSNTTWKERIFIETPEAIINIHSKNSNDLSQEDSTLLQEFSNSLITDASHEDAAIAQEVYEQHKVEGADLIAVDVTLPEKVGIINCRKGGQHLQIRF